MRQMMVAAGALALALAGCATTGQQPLPTNYRQMIADFARTQYYFDPYSIRDAGISSQPPGADISLFGPLQTVCVRANARNRMGGYIGIRASRFSFRDGKVVGASQDTTGLLCGGETYEPFPELEAGGNTGIPQSKGR